MSSPELQPISEELRDALAWLVTNGRRAAWRLGADAIMVKPEGVFLLQSRGGRGRSTE